MRETGLSREYQNEIESAIGKAFDRHGNKFTYRAVPGTRVDLTKLKANQRICYGGEWFHILMTENPDLL